MYFYCTNNKWSKTICAFQHNAYNDFLSILLVLQYIIIEYSRLSFISSHYGGEKIKIVVDIKLKL